MTHRTRIAALALTLAVLLTVPARTLAQVTEANVRVRAAIQEIDLQNRLLSLRPPGGTVSEYRVPDAVDMERFEVGDTVTVTFLHPLALHLRRPGAPAADLAQLHVPGGSAAVLRTESATVTTVDPSVPSISVRGSRGQTATFRITTGLSVADFAVGDTVDVTFLIPEVISLTNQ